MSRIPASAVGGEPIVPPTQARENGAATQTAPGPATQTAPIGPATQLLLVQFAQLQQAGLAQLAIAAASADQKPRDAGWQLDVERRVWVRPAPDPEAPRGT